MAAIKTSAAVIRTDRTGKVFVVHQGMRTCLVCERRFSRQASAEHAKVACYPAVPYVRPIGNQK